MTLLRPDRAMVQTDRRLRDTSCIRHQTCHGIPISWTTPQRPPASARISRGVVRTVEVLPCEEIRCAIPARVAEGRHHHSSTSDGGTALHRCWNPYRRGTAFHLVRSTTHGQACECSRPAGGPVRWALTDGSSSSPYTRAESIDLLEYRLIFPRPGGEGATGPAHDAQRGPLSMH